MLEGISMVQGLRKTRLPLQHLTFKVKFQGQIRSFFQLFPKLSTIDILSDPDEKKCITMT